MTDHQRRQWTWLCVALCLAARPAAAITIQVDYTYDLPGNGGTNFFGSGNPQGATAGTQAKAALEAAASYFSSILIDSFTAIQTPAPYHSSVSDGVVTWSWQESFTSPASGSVATATDPTVLSNRYVVYAGARGLSGTTAGFGGPGGYGWSSNVTGANLFSQADLDQINATSTSFGNAVETRGQTSGFSRWGGAITFDTSARTWHYDHTTSPTVGETDFYSVAIHELGHALGFGETTMGSVWNAYVNAGNSTFIGPYAMSENGGNSVPLAGDLAHWATGTNSTVYGGLTGQEAAMDPDLLDGTRKYFTWLDAAALRDIGWELTTPPGVPGDYNNNGKVDAADYVLWRKGGPLANEVNMPGTVNAADYTAWRARFGNTSGSGSGAVVSNATVPEPACIAMFLLGGVLFGATQRLRLRGRDLAVSA
jgi:hypothetical protein